MQDSIQDSIQDSVQDSIQDSITCYSEIEGGAFGTSLRLGGWTRRLLLSRLRHLETGRLRWFEGDQVLTFGSTAAATAEATLEAEVRVVDHRFYERLVFGGAVGAAEAYMAGYWTTPDLTAVLRLILVNRQVLDGLDTGWARLAVPVRWLFQRLRANTRHGSRRNIVAHYDLGNDFFELFLDHRMMYSCAIFERPEMDLEQASVAKLERLCRKLDLGPEDHLLEIGTGWGGFAVHAATHYGCRVTTTTISPSQAAHARRVVAAAGLSHRVEVLEQDYRDLEGHYDKLISIEMIEAVGLDNLDTYFARCAELLRPEGVMALQAITFCDRHFDRYKGSVDFIQRYIFPGSALVSVASMTTSVARATDLQLVHLEDFGPHYATTLRRWRERFFDQLDTVRGQGFSESFIRMWEYYFCYCEAGFLERTTGVSQWVLTKPGARQESLLGSLA